MKKIITIVGARPQFIKLAPVSRELRKQYKEIIINTGQHYDYNMAGVFFEELDIPKPDYDLGVGSGSHGKQTGDMLAKIEEVIFTEQPDAVLVYGDTNSTLAGALAASKLHIPLFHVEAGLRSYNKRMPEEVNRVLTDHVSDLLFCPTEHAINNLKKEGITENAIAVGDVMYDAVKYNIKIAEQNYSLGKFNVEKGSYILATIHRAENTDDRARLEAIFTSLSRLSNTIILPLHPRTQRLLREQGLFHLIESSDNIQIIEPVSYLEMLLLEQNAMAIITDSGGVQKEAYFAKVPCFTLRDQTEWVETVEVGWNMLVNPITQDLAELVKDKNMPIYKENLYGDGHASSKIVEQIDHFFNEKEDV
ncbi:non-hydrolyzing UDP-N-acetylglucosamine 2-epimerase [Metabacillus halosaccharovorans]|uniref:UDP-N-acetylglucosamine 2-epimerase (Non-hydrolyzing) n=1 Tax=Metabacillus halosaccharovorans TaxID=930124 RepID=A0ABT3DCG3_9BACI|nr:UDP-N-acetylglucosamine 2-epimerase (non-hydrolyzing) [Metabacillus halosaccharovorans]MCV9884749.1 UDP-N-acetylglucosamine 2-epimerase (non-hydrolyzing) [Metabacillus halosaccharovorans]